MKFLIFPILCICSLAGCSQSLVEVRVHFHKAVLDPEQSKPFHEFLKDVNQATPTIKAYQATSEAMLARVAWNPFVKLAQVMRYEDIMEVAVKEDKENIEIRFLRLATEYNLPKFLGMSRHIQEDRDTIVRNMASIESLNLDASFARFILYFLSDSGLCNDQEIARMEKSLSKSKFEESVFEHP